MKKYTVLFMLACFFYAESFAQKPIPYGNNAAVGKYVQLRGINMYYETYGTGKPLLFIHGNGGDISNFKKQIPYFSKHYKVIIADSRAQGKTVDNGDSLTYEMMADDLSALLDKLKLDSCFVVGWSDGGINGLLLAMRHPEKVKKLAVTGANLWPDSSAVDPFIYRWLQRDVDSLSKLHLTGAQKNNYKLMLMMTKEPNIKLDQLKTIQCPTLVIGGDHDILVPQHTLIIAEAIPQSYLWILPNSGHSTLINYSKQFNETVEDFFKKPFKVIREFDRFN